MRTASAYAAQRGPHRRRCWPPSTGIYVIRTERCPPRSSRPNPRRSGAYKSLSRVEFLGVSASATTTVGSQGCEPVHHPYLEGRVRAHVVPLHARLLRSEWHMRRALRAAAPADDDVGRRNRMVSGWPPDYLARRPRPSLSLGPRQGGQETHAARRPARPQLPDLAGRTSHTLKSRNRVQIFRTGGRGRRMRPHPPCADDTTPSVAEGLIPPESRMRRNPHVLTR